MRMVLLVGLVCSSLVGCGRDDGTSDASMPPDMAGDGDMALDPIVGQPCGGAGMAFCPCGYFCPAGKCERADFHPPCGDGGM